MNIPFKKDGKVTTFWLKEARERLLKAVQNAEHADSEYDYTRIPVTLHDTVLEEDLEFDSLSDAAWYLGVTKGMASTAATKGRVVNGYLIIRHGTQSGKKIEQLDMVTGEVIKTYPTIESASKETGVKRCNISLCCHGRQKTAGGFRWRFDDECESAKRYSEQWWNRQRAGVRKATKPVLQINRNTGEVIRRWECAADAWRVLGISKTHISACCNGRQKTAGGYRWCLEKDFAHLAE